MRGIFAGLAQMSVCGNFYDSVKDFKKSENVGCSEKKEANEAFSMKRNENEIGNQKLFWKAKNVRNRDSNN